jgi:hypothetical protein
MHVDDRTAGGSSYRRGPGDARCARLIQLSMDGSIEKFFDPPLEHFVEKPRIDALKTAEGYDHCCIICSEIRVCNG